MRHKTALALALSLAAVFAAGCGGAQAAPAAKPTVVLVSGAFEDGSS